MLFIPKTCRWQGRSTLLNFLKFVITGRKILPKKRGSKSISILDEQKKFLVTLVYLDCFLNVVHLVKPGNFMKGGWRSYQLPCSGPDIHIN